MPLAIWAANIIIVIVSALLTVIYLLAGRPWWALTFLAILVAILVDIAVGMWKQK